MINRTRIPIALTALLSVLTLPHSVVAEAQSEPEPIVAETQSASPNLDSPAPGDEKARADAETQAQERRNKIVKDAVDALSKTRDALKALDENKTDEALAALSEVTGTLELLVAREPALALAPVDVKVITRDVYATRESLDTAIEQASDALDAGRIQEARTLLGGLASEIVISVSSLPLATYPDAIKSVTPMIDNGESEQAKRVLSTALSTLVVEDTVLPLPVIRGEENLLAAEQLAENSERSDEEDEQLRRLLAEARAEYEIAERLGYGDRKLFQPIYQEIKDIEKKVEGGKSGRGFFTRIKDVITGLAE